MLRVDLKISDYKKKHRSYAFYIIYYNLIIITCCSPCTNLTLYVNDISIKLEKHHNLIKNNLSDYSF